MLFRLQLCSLLVSLLFLRNLHCGPVAQLRLTEEAIREIQDDLDSFIRIRMSTDWGLEDFEEISGAHRIRFTQLRIVNLTSNPVVLPLGDDRHNRHHIRVQQEIVRFTLVGQVIVDPDGHMSRSVGLIADVGSISLGLTLSDHHSTADCRVTIRGYHAKLQQLHLRGISTTNLIKLIQQKIPVELKMILCSTWSSALTDYLREKLVRTEEEFQFHDDFHGRFAVEVGITRVPHVIGSEVILPLAANLIDQQNRSALKSLSSRQLANLTSNSFPSDKTFHLVVTTDLLNELLKMAHLNGWTEFYLNSLNNPDVSEAFQLDCADFNCIGSLLPPDVVERHMRSKVEFLLKGSQNPPKLISSSRPAGMRMEIVGTIDVYSRFPNGSAEYLLSLATQLHYNCLPTLTNWRIGAQLSLVDQKTTLTQSARRLPMRESLMQSLPGLPERLVDGLNDVFLDPKMNEMFGGGFPLPLAIPKGFSLLSPVANFFDGFVVLSANLTRKHKNN